MAEKITKVKIDATVFAEFNTLKSSMGLLPFNPPSVGHKVQITEEMIKNASAKQLRSLLYHGPRISNEYECTVTKDQAPKREIVAPVPKGAKAPKKPKMIEIQNAEWKSIGDEFFEIEGLEGLTPPNGN